MLQSVMSQAVQVRFPYPASVCHVPSGHDITHDCLSADRYQLPFVHESQLPDEHVPQLVSHVVQTQPVDEVCPQSPPPLVYQVTEFT